MQPARKLGQSGLEVSPLCFGGNVFGWTADERRENSLHRKLLRARGWSRPSGLRLNCQQEPALAAEVQLIFLFAALLGF
jgi:hypothetical protein